MEGHKFGGDLVHMGLISVQQQHFRTVHVELRRKCFTGRAVTNHCDFHGPSVTTYLTYFMMAMSQYVKLRKSRAVFVACDFRMNI